MKHNQMRQVVFPILAAFIWGTAFVAQDLCADAIDAFTFNAVRSYIAVVVLLIIIFISDRLKKDTPVLTAAEKKRSRRDLLVGGLCCGTALAVLIAALVIWCHRDNITRLLHHQERKFQWHTGTPKEKE